MSIKGIAWTKVRGFELLLTIETRSRVSSLDTYVFSLKAALRHLFFVTTGTTTSDGPAPPLQIWSVSHIVLVGHWSTKIDGLDSLDWKEMAIIIPSFPYLQSFDAFLREDDVQKFAELDTELHTRLPGVPLRVKRIEPDDDLSKLVPELFKAERVRL